MGFLWWIIVAALTVYPLWQLMPKFRLPPAMALIAIIPFGAIALLWLMAFRDKVKIPGIDS